MTNPSFGCDYSDGTPAGCGKTDVSYARVRELALSFPKAYEDSPWGFPVFKVRTTRFSRMLNERLPLEVTMKVGAEEREIGALLPLRPAREPRRSLRLGDREGRATRMRCRTALDWVRESYWLKAPAKLREAAFR